MRGSGPSPAPGLAGLRRALASLLLGGLLAEPLLAGPLLATASPIRDHPGPGDAPLPGDAAPPGSSPEPRHGDDDDRLNALVDLARSGDAEAFGALYDYYSPAVYRFIYYRVGSANLAEDLVSDTFFRALRSMDRFTGQGGNFGAWLTTIARNLIADHYKSSRVRREHLTDDFTRTEESSPGPEDEVLADLTDDALRRALRQLPGDQQECLVLRFLNEASITETALALGRSEGAIKQLQLRALRNLAKLLPEEVRRP